LLASGAPDTQLSGVSVTAAPVRVRWLTVLSCIGALSQIPSQLAKSLVEQPLKLFGVDLIANTAALEKLIDVLPIVDLLHISRKNCVRFHGGRGHS
jgi:hypothetical protein